VAGAVGELLADPDRAAHLGAAGRAMMAREWTWEASAARLQDFIAGRVGESDHALG